MRIAISTFGPTLDDRIDERFGRASHLIVVETDTLEFEAIDNSENQRALQGSGIGAAEAISSAGAKVVITGHLGPKAFTALGVAGIRGFKGTGMTAREAVAAYLAGDLHELDEGESHSGMQ